MQYRKLGNSDLNVPVISFGAWAAGGWMWGGPDDDNAVRAMDTAIDLGITCIDTAPAYGMGHSETLVGRAIFGKRDRVVIATKCGLRWDCTDGERYFDTQDNEGHPKTLYRNLRPQSVRHECEQSLRRMKIDHIDLYQCHWPDSTTPTDETMGALLDLRQQGKIRAIGVSNFTADMMRQCLETATIASDQPPYSALVRGAETEVLPFCRENGIGVLAYSPLAQGLLTGKVSVDREFPEGDLRRTKPLFTRENRVKAVAMLEQVKPIAEAHHATLGQVFLAWIVAQPGMTTALAGARNETQVRENAGAGDLQLADDEIAQIRDWVEQGWPIK
jgi:aryl-alcohol dehydrogenase-like predicted oxidoreductase